MVYIRYPRKKLEDETAEILFVDEETGKRKTIVNRFGSICRFPGIVKEKCWTEYLSGGRMPTATVNYRSDIDVYDEFATALGAKIKVHNDMGNTT